MMSIRDLNREQLAEVKGNYLADKIMREEKRGISYGELANADTIVSDEEVFGEYEGTVFSPDDFCCCA